MVGCQGSGGGGEGRTPGREMSGFAVSRVSCVPVFLAGVERPLSVGVQCRPLGTNFHFFCPQTLAGQALSGEKGVEVDDHPASYKIEIFTSCG